MYQFRIFHCTWVCKSSYQVRRKHTTFHSHQHHTSSSGKRRTPWTYQIRLLPVARQHSLVASKWFHGTLPKQCCIISDFKIGTGIVPRGILTFTHKFPLFPQVSWIKRPFTMSSKMLAHKVVGPSSRFSEGFPVVTQVTKITNDVLFLIAYYQNHDTIPLDMHTLLIEVG